MIGCGNPGADLTGHNGPERSVKAGKSKWIKGGDLTATGAKEERERKSIEIQRIWAEEKAQEQQLDIGGFVDGFKAKKNYEDTMAAEKREADLKALAKQRQREAYVRALAQQNERSRALAREQIKSGDYKIETSRHGASRRIVRKKP